MSKGKFLLIVSFTVTIILLFLTYKVIIPSYIADLLTQEKAPSYLPEKYKNQVERIHKPIRKYSNEIFNVTDSLQLSLNDLLKIIDDIDPDEVLKVYQLLENKEVKSSEEVFNLICEHITIQKIEIQTYKHIFLKHATTARINRILRYAEEHNLVTSIAPATAKKIARQLVIKHYQKQNEFLN